MPEISDSEPEEKPADYVQKVDIGVTKYGSIIYDRPMLIINEAQDLFASSSYKVDLKPRFISTLTDTENIESEALQTEGNELFLYGSDGASAADLDPKLDGVGAWCVSTDYMQWEGAFAQVILLEE